MSIRSRLQLFVSPLAVTLGLAAIAAGGQATAQTAVDSVTVSAPIKTAPYEAPTTAPLTATQPTSVLNQHFIENYVNPTANYDDIVRISPSVNSVGPNGPGLMENQFLTIRGFQDGQYNLTIDGIAWGDSNDFTHHSTSYVMAHDLGQVSVDRGPGTASTLGDATFGGTIALQTKTPQDRLGGELYGSVASFSTYLEGGELDTGPIQALNGAKVMIDAEHLQSDGFLTNMGQRRTNVFAKIVAPVAPNTTVTVAGMYNTIHQNVGLGATLDQIRTNGYNWGLSSDPTSQDYYGYNYDNITTDLVYADLKSDLGSGLTVDNKVYTYAYYHRGFNGEDPNGETANGTSLGASDVPGQKMINNYMSVGDMARVSKDFGIVTLKAGFWYDHQANERFQREVDYTLGGAPSVNGGVAVDRFMHDSLDTFQPYIEADFKPIDGLTITPGVKYAYFHRIIDAPVNQKTGLPLNFSKTYDEPLPSVAVHYQIAPQWSVYAQVAQGFLAPNLNTFYTTDPALSTTLKPETTWNYQLGGSFQTDRLTLSGDVYYIDFGNMIGHRTVQGNVIFFNQGGVVYQGVEAEGDYRIWGPFSVYANGSLNSAVDKTSHSSIANSPKSTAALGVTYDDHNFNASLLAKYTGPRYGDVDGANMAIYHFNGYTTAQLSLGYTIPRTSSHPQIKISGLIDNLFDARGANALAGYTGADGNPLYWNIVPRNYELRIAAAF